MTRWTVRNAAIPCNILGFIECRDIDVALSQARKLHGHNVTVDNRRIRENESEKVAVATSGAAGGGHRKGNAPSRLRRGLVADESQG